MEPILNGSFNPSWVFSGIVTILCFLVWRMLTKIENKVDKHDDKLNNHDTSLQLHEQKLDDHDSQFRNHKQSTRELAEEVVRKMHIAFEIKRL